MTESFSTFERFEHSKGTLRFNSRLRRGGGGGGLDSIATRWRERAVTSLVDCEQSFFSQSSLSSAGLERRIGGTGSNH